MYRFISVKFLAPISVAMYLTWNKQWDEKWNRMLFCIIFNNKPRKLSRQVNTIEGEVIVILNKNICNKNCCWFLGN